MKKIKIVTLGLALIAISCKKHEIIPSPYPDAAALIAFTNANIEEAEQHYTVNANAPIYIVGEKGTVLTLGADKLIDADGNIVNGNVDVTLIEIDKKSEMIMMNKATVGKKSNGDHATLVSQGEFYVSISKNGIELTLTEPIVLSAPILAEPGMRKFVNISDTDDLLWNMAEDSILDVADDSAGFSTTYDILPGEWGWTNIDKFYADPRPKTTIFAEMPEGFDNTNCEVYISYNGESNALAQFDVWTEGRFTEHYGLIPIGLEVNFIAVGIVDGELHYAIEPATITTDHVQKIDHFTAISSEALITLIDALP